MATHIEVTRAGANSSFGSLPIETNLIASATITPSSTHQETAFTGLPSGPLFATVTADENVFISIAGPAPAPNAQTDTNKRAMGAGGVRSFAFYAGQQISVVLR